MAPLLLAAPCALPLRPASLPYRFFHSSGRSGKALCTSSTPRLLCWSSCALAQCVSSVCQLLVSHDCRYFYYVWRAKEGLKQVQYTSVRVVSMVVNMQVRESPPGMSAILVCRIYHADLPQPLIPGRPAVWCSMHLKSNCSLHLQTGAQLWTDTSRDPCRMMLSLPADSSAHHVLSGHDTFNTVPLVRLSKKYCRGCLAAWLVPFAPVRTFDMAELWICRFQKIGTCTALLEVGNLSVCLSCRAGNAGHMLRMLRWLTAASFQLLQLARPSTSWAHAAQHCSGWHRLLLLACQASAGWVLHSNALTDSRCCLQLARQDAS